MYYIQRGSFREDLASKKEFLSGKDDALVRPDYMGYAEFEFGAIPNSYTRILLNIDKYELHNTGIYTTAGKKLFIYCKEDQYEYALNWLKEYVRTGMYTKTYINFSEHFQFTKVGDKLGNEDHYWAIKTDFWWEIHDDIMFFVCDISKGYHWKFLEILEKDAKELALNPNI